MEPDPSSRLLKTMRPLRICIFEIVRYDPAPGPGNQEVHKQEGKIGFVVIPVVGLRIINYNRKKQDGTSDQTDQGSMCEFV